MGLLEGALIENPLYVPQENGSLAVNYARAGAWVAWDIQRKSVLGRNGIKQQRKGTLGIFLPDEVRDHEKGEYTPTDLLEPLSIDHFLTYESPSISYILGKGLVEETTYGRALQREGLYEKYARAMGVLNIEGKRVFQVTPKGNTLIYLLNDGGDTVTKEERAKELEPATAE